MTVPLFQVDAFTNRKFHGNPAAVCPLTEWLDDEVLLAVAAENNLSETAYFVAEDGGYRLRWFTPRSEVNLCGHATLASAFVLLTILQPERQDVSFSTRSGKLTVRRDGNWLRMDFPALVPWECVDPPAALLKGLGLRKDQASVLQLKDNFFVVYRSEDNVRSLQPDLAQLETLHPAGVCVTAPGKNVDFVSRYFAPSYGIPEDPVTGSTHCSLTPYWTKRLGKSQLQARQVSPRGGDLQCEMVGDRVLLKGQAVLTMQGSLLIG
ncbi:MAG TPA: PhzF family phenazine biosynthesis protein [Candidatus Sulfotelmatobacter sp.]|nr:PhzF family phenazine biosynthesis protein [Candidatus Sulfotelmatobacter sp.]